MSKNKIKKEKEKTNKWLYIIFFTLPLIFTVLLMPKIDNDMWYLLSEGRQILRNGIYYIDPLSMHEGLQVTVQNWLSASIFYAIYSLFGAFGLYTTMLICNIVICYLTYKIAMLISDNNKILSLLVMFIGDITLASYYIVTRPQVFSFILLLTVIYLLEKYIKTDNEKYLKWLPLLSLIEVNMHASLWWMMFLFILPYLIDSFKIPFLNTEGYRKKPLFIATLVSLLVGFINPYGYKAITFIFTSYGDKYMHAYINELLPFSINNSICIHMLIIIIIIGVIYTLFRSGNVRLRYLCLFFGTMLLGLMSIKGFAHFCVVAFFPLAYFFKDIFPKDFSDLPIDFKKILNILITCFGILCLGFGGFLYIRNFSKLEFKANSENALKRLASSFDPNASTVYSSFNDGGTVEFYGFKPYIDPRAEVYLKINNKKDDIFEENYKLQHNQLDIKTFLEKYNFTHLLVQNTDILYNNLEDTDYLVIYEDTEKGYRLYVNKNILSEEDRKSAEEAYKKAIEEAKKASEN